MSEMRAKAVNENQCSMCMPLGGIIAFKGVENSMSLVHGSQGCSTYMRLTTIEHYNEPVDIASSSLNEKQTIYGGEANLLKALDNVIRVYRPKVIGVVTTCLAETIGEDLDRMVEKYLKDRSIDGIDIIPVATPSYSGSMTEGFWAATKALIAYYAGLAEKHDGINVIIPHISPADIREIKRILDLMGAKYTLLPDYSMTLDRPYGGQYTKIAPGGTSPADIARMGGAKATIQFGLTCPDELSPGLYLQQEHGVPLINLPLPIGLETPTASFARCRRSPAARCPKPSRWSGAGCWTAWPTLTSTTLAAGPSSTASRSWSTRLPDCVWRTGPCQQSSPRGAVTARPLQGSSSCWPRQGRTRCLP